jgi:hypothetical protein
MSTGPEHYREAEILIAFAFESKDTTFEGHNPEADRCIAAAQVHATLALAAATVGRLADRYIGDGDHINTWLGAVKQTPPADIAEPEPTPGTRKAQPNAVEGGAVNA